MKDATPLNGTDERLEARSYRAEQGLVDTVEEMSERASHVVEQTKAIVETTKAISKPMVIGAMFASATLAGGIVWAIGRRRPSALERLFKPKPRSRLLPLVGRAATSLAIAAGTTALRTFLLAKLERVLEQALESTGSTEP
ncbi:MAG: hypothetical protein U0414_16225 [Polyangiaceae bacterium]